MYREIDRCRLCESPRISQVLDLGIQCLTGIFPKSADADVPKGPLELVKCADCGLVQLGHNYDPSVLYGANYGYRSGLNASMVRHLNAKVQRILERISLQSGDLVLDIGSNDGTLLSAYPEGGPDLLGIDPTAAKFRGYYPSHVQVVEELFSARAFRGAVGERKAKVVTSIAMLYDLEHPLAFVQDVASILDEEGIWVFEQSYLPFMLETNSYDTICHEHLEYYALEQIRFITERSDLKIIDVEFNDINGGSFSVAVAKAGSAHSEATSLIETTLERERALGIGTDGLYDEFRPRIAQHRDRLLALLTDLKADGKTVFGYGASTKGNVLLQYCGIDRQLVPLIAEVNEDKFGAFTPGTRIPIISEAEAHEMKPDYFLVLPWHFRKSILERETDYLARGGKFIFPLPEIEVFSA